MRSSIGCRRRWLRCGTDSHGQVCEAGGGGTFCVHLSCIRDVLTICIINTMQEAPSTIRGFRASTRITQKRGRRWNQAQGSTGLTLDLDLPTAFLSFRKGMAAGTTEESVEMGSPKRGKIRRGRAEARLCTANNVPSAILSTPVRGFLGGGGMPLPH